MNPETTLAISIFAHGDIIVDDHGKPIENKNFPGVYIKKNNTSYYGCVSTPYQAVDYDEPDDITRQAMDSIDTCILPGYVDYIKDAVEQKEDCYQLMKPEKSCILFDGRTEYYEKKYTFDDDFNYIGFMIRYNGEHIINIVECFLYDLLSFFTRKFSFDFGFDTLLFLENPATHPYASGAIEAAQMNLTQEQRLYFNTVKERVIKINTVCSKFVKERSPEITTTQIFDLIALAKDCLNVTRANILDLSCSVVERKNTDECDDCDGYSINGNCVTPTLAWGGKFKRTKRRKPTKRKLKCSHRKRICRKSKK